MPSARKHQSALHEQPHLDQGLRQETSHNLEETLPVTLRLPKKTITPGSVVGSRPRLRPEDVCETL